MTTQFDPVEDVIAGIAAGEIVIVVDDDDRENEGSDHGDARATPEKVAFMIRHTSGIRVRRFDEEAKRLHRSDGRAQRCADEYGVYRFGRLQTRIDDRIPPKNVRAIPFALANGNVGAADFVRPGHIFPLVARTGGVLVRSARKQASISRRLPVLRWPAPRRKSTTTALSNVAAAVLPLNTTSRSLRLRI
jgi:3,4-dihydroxy 2-butanone 4-phosphate synthase/GTP cyclohydrolase II